MIRRFGGKEGPFTAAVERESAAIRDQRALAPVGDTPEAVRILLDHYEAYGDRVLKMLAEQDRLPSLRPIVDVGHAVHQEWCARVFARALASRVGVDRRRRLAQLMAVCDVYTWNLLRRNAGLSRRQTELAIVELLTPLVEGDS